jgi:HAD superfamily hydrolase (TIGR01509 family)
MIEAVVFDLDGVLLDSEAVWDRARRSVAEEDGRRWKPDATAAMQGMSSPEWAGYMHEHLGVAVSEPEIVRRVVTRVFEEYEKRIPWLPGSVEAVERLAERWPLALASSSNREVIDHVLSLSGLAQRFAVTVSSEEVARGKPAPDVYLEAARRLGRQPRRCVAVEDSTNGIRSALAAGLAVVAVPNRDYPPDPAVTARAALVVDQLDQLSVPAVEGLDEGSAQKERRLDEQEVESFPASDPHSDWAGPPG